MRKIILFFFITLYAVTQAQNEPSSLQIRMWDNSLFSAVFANDEGGRFQRAYNVRSLEGGEYYLRIMQRTTSGVQTIFEGQIEIPPASRVQAIVNDDGSLEISALEDVQHSSSSFDLKTRIEDMKAKGQTNTAAQQRNLMIQPLELQDLSNEMSRAVTEQVRDSIGTAGLRRNLFTTAYVVQLAKLYRTEELRLNFSKSAYTRVVDPENYFQVKMLFTRKENIESLETYMQENANRVQRRKESEKLF